MQEYRGKFVTKLLCCVGGKYNKVKYEAISVEFTFLIVAVIERISVEYSERISSLSANQFMVEKSDFE